MRLLFLTCWPGVRGPIPKITPLLVSALAELGCEVETEPWGRHRDDERPAQKLVSRLADIGRIRARLQRSRPDLMVVTTSHDWPALSRDLPLLAATRRLCPRTVLHLHGSLAERLAGPGHRAFRSASARLLDWSDAVLVLSSEEQRLWQQFRPESDVRVVNNPYQLVPAPRTVPTLLPWPLPADRPLLLFASRLIAVKGILDLLEAMPLLLPETPCHLLVLGHGEDEARVRQQVAKLGLEGHVTLGGYLEGDLLHAAYRRADLLVLPTYWSEGFPTAIAEAMDAGLPVVTTRARGMADHLHAGENALFVPAHDPGELANTLRYALANPLLLARMGRANQALVRRFAPRLVAEEYLQILREVLAGSPSPVATGGHGP